jgi:hypothetical protein
MIRRENALMARHIAVTDAAKDATTSQKILENVVGPEGLEPPTKPL